MIGLESGVGCRCSVRRHDSTSQGGSGLLYFLEEVSCLLQSFRVYSKPEAAPVPPSLPPSLALSRHFSCLAFSQFWQQEHKVWDRSSSSSTDPGPPIKRGNEEFKPKWVSSRLRGRLRLAYVRSHRRLLQVDLWNTAAFAITFY
jgi:hypothetical protein